ncbi:hypothetical protein Slin14017_G062740 [Septoria linicola]|nr:hypothetical protein Slin14017_G062740 [Septoria linicola]
MVRRQSTKASHVLLIGDIQAKTISQIYTVPRTSTLHDTVEYAGLYQLFLLLVQREAEFDKICIPHLLETGENSADRLSTEDGKIVLVPETKELETVLQAGMEGSINVYLTLSAAMYSPTQPSRAARSSDEVNSILVL